MSSVFAGLPAGDRNTVVELSIASTWKGDAIAADERVSLRLEQGSRELVWHIRAPFHGDPPPPSPVGPTAELWHHEVVELMLLGEHDHYLEVEVSPHGHYLALLLEGRRNIVRQGMSMAYSAQINTDAWTGTANIPNDWIPTGCTRLNAYAMRGLGVHRRHFAWQARIDADPHARPDFHRLETFGALSDCRRVLQIPTLQTPT